VLGEWWMIALIAALLVAVIMADKVPAVEHVDHVLQIAEWPAAGGLLAVSAPRP
jgi:hypothetical protein